MSGCLIFIFCEILYVSCQLNSLHVSLLYIVSKNIPGFLPDSTILKQYVNIISNDIILYIDFSIIFLNGELTFLSSEKIHLLSNLSQNIYEFFPIKFSIKIVLSFQINLELFFVSSNVDFIIGTP